MGLFNKLMNALKPLQPIESTDAVPLGPEMTIEVAIPVAQFMREDDPSDAFKRARGARGEAIDAFLALAGRRRVSVHAVDFVEFDSDNADIAIAYFAIDYSGEEINGTEQHYQEGTDGEA